MTVVIFYFTGVKRLLREAKKKQTKDAIVRHAVELFKLKGYENVTVEEITTVCGIAKGTFFNYFPKKEHILLHLTETYAPLLDDFFRRYPEAETMKRLLLVFRDMLALYAKHYGILRHALLETAKLSGAVSGPNTGSNLFLFEERLASFLSEEAESGRFRSGMEPRLGASILSDLFIYTLIARSGADRFDEEEAYGKLSRQVSAVWEGFTDDKV